MRSITLAQTALFAAVATGLLTAFYLIDDSELLANAPALVLLGSAFPSFIWAGFFFVVYRSPLSARTAAWITLIFAVLLEGIVVYIRFQQAVSYWTPFGDALSMQGWLLRVGWAVFLILFALAPNSSRTRQIALALAIVSAPSALLTVYNTWNSWIGLLFDGIPHEAFWRVVMTPAIRTVYWLSQVLFLWKAYGGSPLRQSSSRFAP
jgi:hypothetical protein